VMEICRSCSGETQSQTLHLSCERSLPLLK
jgi:hypothetical protein